MNNNISSIDQKNASSEPQKFQELRTLIASRRFVKIPSCAVNLEDLKKLYLILEPTVKEAAEIEFSNIKNDILKKNPDKLEEVKNYLTDIYKLSVEIESLGSSGEYIIGHSIAIFEDDNIPDEIGLIRYQSGAYYKFNESNRDPDNHFIIQFDFSKSGLLDPLNPVAYPTPNNSYVKINGKNGTWVSGIFEKVNTFLANKKKKRGWIHTTYIYDLLLFALGFPISFWVVYRINVLLKSVIKWPIALEVAFYVYIVLFCLRTFLFVFGYARWLFPLIEFEGGRKNISKAHRLFFSTLGIGISGAIIYDIIKILFV
jgi:hypothetical protein